LLPVDLSSVPQEVVDKLNDFKSASKDLAPDFLHAMATLSEDWSGVALYADSNPDNFYKLISRGQDDLQLFVTPTTQSSILENLGVGLSFIYSSLRAYDEIKEGHSPEQAIGVASVDFLNTVASGVVGSAAADAVTGAAIVGSDGLLLPVAPLIYATTDFA